MGFFIGLIAGFVGMWILGRVVLPGILWIMFGGSSEKKEEGNEK